MRVELSALALVPLTRTTFHIPVDRIVADGEWVPLPLPLPLAKCPVNMSFQHVH